MAVRISFILFTIIGVLYPFVVWFGLSIVSPFVIGVFILVLLLARLIFTYVKGGDKADVIAILAVIVGLSGIFAVDQMMAVRSYPILLSLMLAIVFSVSMLRPPTVIERVARLIEPDLNARGVRYTRKVTGVWIGFFLFNALVSAATAFHGDMKIWTLYNGMISYMLAGTLFGFEYLIRQQVKQSHKGPVGE